MTEGDRQHNWVHTSGLMLLLCLCDTTLPHTSRLDNGILPMGIGTKNDDGTSYSRDGDDDDERVIQPYDIACLCLHFDC